MKIIMNTTETSNKNDKIRQTVWPKRSNPQAAHSQPHTNFLLHNLREKIKQTVGVVEEMRFNARIADSITNPFLLRKIDEKMPSHKTVGVVEEMRFKARIADSITNPFLLRKIDEKMKILRALMMKRTKVRESSARNKKFILSLFFATKKYLLLYRIPPVQ